MHTRRNDHRTRLTSGLIAAAALLTLLSPAQASEFDSLWTQCDSCCLEPRTLFRWGLGGGPLGGPPGYDEPLVTDRPTFTPASVTVGRGVVQLESGYLYAYATDGDETSRTHVFPELNLRIGVLADWLELRLGWTYIDEREREPGAVDRTSGGSDLNVGLTFALTAQKGLLPEMALITQLELPAGHPDLSGGTVMPGVFWIYDWWLTDFISAGGSTSGRRVGSVDEHTYTEFAQSGVVRYHFHPRLTGFTEWWGLFPHSAIDESPQHFFQGGFAYLVTNNLQLDVRGGLQLRDEGDGYFFGTGASVRF